MSAVPKPKKLTVEEYFAIEEKAERKSEFFNGEMFLMAGASREHNILSRNLVGELYQRLKGSRCQVFFSDLRVKVDRTGLYTYPDLLVVCDDLEFAPENKNTLTNPKVVIEILSDSTERYDRTTKFRHYKALPSLQKYVLVAQDEPLVERYVRQPDGVWGASRLRRNRCHTRPGHRARERADGRSVPRAGVRATEPVTPMLDEVYAELRRLAAARMAREPAGHTLDATALVHEAYLKLADRLPTSRSEFLCAAAVAMRRVLIDHARGKHAAKRAGRRLTLDPDQLAAAAFDPADLLALDDALTRLTTDDPMAASLAELRLFAGLSTEEAGDALGVSRATAYRLWQYARARLSADLAENP